MHAKNQVSLTCKTLYGIMLLAVIHSAFGAGNLPSAHAQEGTLETPTPTSEPPPALASCLSLPV